MPPFIVLGAQHVVGEPMDLSSNLASETQENTVLVKSQKEQNQDSGSSSQSEST